MAITAPSLENKNFNILTDLPSVAELKALTALARKENAALDRLLKMAEANEIRLTDSAIVKITPDENLIERLSWFYYLVTTIKPILTVETGFYQGLTASAITLAHMANGLHGGHVPVQDRAKQVENGVGFKLLQDLGLSGYQIMEHEPAMVLPQIYLQNLSAGLNLVYFNHATATDEQMMEYFYLNNLLNEGGVMVINMDHPARRYLVDYLQSERHDTTIRRLECGLVLAQKPLISDMMADVFSVRH